MTKIKICGMTREADVAAAVELGVDAVGFVLWNRSPRSASPALARTLVRMLPPLVTPVAVLVDPTEQDVARAIDDVGCHVVQVHGRADAALARGCGHVVCAVTLSDEEAPTLPTIDPGLTVLLDAHDPERRGGTGRTIDWQRAAVVARERRVMLAGGLTPSNVAEAVRAVRPYGVDVASGVEREPGIKDRAAMRAFVDAVRSVDSTSQIDR